LHSLFGCLDVVVELGVGTLAQLIDERILCVCALQPSAGGTEIESLRAREDPLTWVNRRTEEEDSLITWLQRGEAGLAMAPPTAYPALDCDLEFDVAVIVLRDVDDIADARAVAALAPRTRFARTLAALRLPEVVAA